jgi:hypothetical protein
MDIKSAQIILNLNPPYDIKELKKHYYNAALKEHPDKNNNSVESTEKFKNIKNAYEKLSDHLNSKENISENYLSFIDEFIYKFININDTNSTNDTNDTNDTNNKHLLEELIKKCKLYSLKAIENFDKNKSIKILDFIMKYSEIIGLDQDAIDSIKEIIKNKFQFDELVILNPSIDNLLDSDVYKLEYDNDIYYIPLWHQEITYDLSGKSLIVKCEPALEEHMYIDEKNTLHVNIKTSIIKLLDEQELDINIGKKVFKINISKLKLMRKQTYIIYKKGIKNIDINNIYNDNDKGNIIVHITICDKVCY